MGRAPGVPRRRPASGSTAHDRRPAPRLVLSIALASSRTPDHESSGLTSFGGASSLVYSCSPLASARPNARLLVLASDTVSGPRLQARRRAGSGSTAHDRRPAPRLVLSIALASSRTPDHERDAHARFPVLPRLGSTPRSRALSPPNTPDTAASHEDNNAAGRRRLARPPSVTLKSP